MFLKQPGVEEDIENRGKAGEGKGTENCFGVIKVAQVGNEGRHKSSLFWGLGWEPTAIAPA